MQLPVKTITAVAAVSALGLATAPAATASPSQASKAPKVQVLNSTVMAPFQLAVNHGKVYVADGFTSQVSQITGSTLTTVATGPQPGEVAGVDLDASGRSLAFTSTDYASGKTALTIKTKGKADVVADLSGYEQSRNPDKRITYGVDHPSACVKKAFEAIPDSPPVKYKGIVESHPYSVASLGGGSWVVADAAGNDLLKVNASGKVSMLAVLPRQPLKITSAMAANLGLPKCAVGVTYNFEAVPTDVEVGPGGMLYVSTLPGGPEDPSMGARGSVYKVNPKTGKASRLATGFAGATNVAVDGSGKVYVAELFGGQISTINKGKPQPYVALPNVLSVEVDGCDLVAGTMAPMNDQMEPTGPGSVVRISAR